MGALQKTTSVRVSNANAAAAEALVVAGYDVSGEVRSDGEPMKGVSFLLFSATVKKEVRGSDEVQKCLFCAMQLIFDSCCTNVS